MQKLGEKKKIYMIHEFLEWQNHALDHVTMKHLCWCHTYECFIDKWLLPFSPQRQISCWIPSHFFFFCDIGAI